MGLWDLLFGWFVVDVVFGFSMGVVVLFWFL